jgi:hypothetical protein
MIKVLLLIAALGLCSCVSTSALNEKRFSEVGRSVFYSKCMRNLGAPVTVCRCLELELIKNGVDTEKKIKQESLQAPVKACLKDVAPTVQEEINQSMAEAAGAI